MSFSPEVFQQGKRHRGKGIGTAEYIQQPRIILLLQYLVQTTFHKHNSMVKYKANGHWRPLRNSLVDSSYGSKNPISFKCYKSNPNT